MSHFNGMPNSASSNFALVLILDEKMVLNGVFLEAVPRMLCETGSLFLYSISWPAIAAATWGTNTQPTWSTTTGSDGTACVPGTWPRMLTSVHFSVPFELRTRLSYKGVLSRFRSAQAFSAPKLIGLGLGAAPW